MKLGWGRHGSRAAFSQIQTAPGTYDMMRCFRRAAFCIVRAARRLRRAATFFSDDGIMPSEGGVLFAEGGSWGSATPMKMGGRGPGGSEARIFSGGNPYQKPKTQRIWSTIFLKMGGLSPALSKMGGRVPPSPPPLWRSPWAAEYLLRASCCIWRAALCLRSAAFNIMIATSCFRRAAFYILRAARRLQRAATLRGRHHTLGGRRVVRRGRQSTFWERHVAFGWRHHAFRGRHHTFGGQRIVRRGRQSTYLLRVSCCI